MKKILLLDDNKDLCQMMLRMFSSFGVEDVSCFHSYDEVTVLDKDALAFDIVFLDINLGINTPSGIDVFNWLVDKQFAGKIIFLTGHARSYPLLKKSLEFPNVRLLEKPADIDLIEAIINE